MKIWNTKSLERTIYPTRNSPGIPLILNIPLCQNILLTLFISFQKTKSFMVLLDLAIHDPLQGPYLALDRCNKVSLRLVIAIHYQLAINVKFIIRKSWTPPPTNSPILWVCKLAPKRLDNIRLCFMIGQTTRTFDTSYLLSLGPILVGWQLTLSIWALLIILHSEGLDNLPLIYLPPQSYLSGETIPS